MVTKNTDSIASLSASVGTLCVLHEDDEYLYSQIFMTRKTQLAAGDRSYAL
eukprot:gene11261-14318_t